MHEHLGSPASAPGLRRRHARGALSRARANPGPRRPGSHRGRRWGSARPAAHSHSRVSRSSSCAQHMDMLRGATARSSRRVHACAAESMPCCTQAVTAQLKQRQWRRAIRPTVAGVRAQRALSRAVAIARGVQQCNPTTGAGAPRQVRCINASRPITSSYSYPTLYSICPTLVNDAQKETNALESAPCGPSRTRQSPCRPPARRRSARAARRSGPRATARGTCRTTRAGRRCTPGACLRALLRR
jgi:hypothetical protein